MGHTEHLSEHQAATGVWRDNGAWLPFLVLVASVLGGACTVDSLPTDRDMGVSNSDMGVPNSDMGNVSPDSGSGCSSTCTSGEPSTCSNSAVSHCHDTNGDGCTEWTTPTHCDHGCNAAGNGCATCSNTCPPGPSLCSSNALYHCQDTNLDGCVEWTIPTPCPLGCNAAGNDCAACSNTCTPGEPSTCINGAVSNCQDTNFDGCHEWSTPTRCAFGCDAGAQDCVDRPTPAETLARLSTYSGWCPIYTQSAAEAPTGVECAVQWFDPWGGTVASMRPRVEQIVAEGGVGGTLLPCLEVNRGDRMQIESAMGRALPLWPSSINDNAGEWRNTLAPEACSLILDWGLATGRISPAISVLFVDSVHADFLGVSSPAAWRAAVAAEFSRLRDRGFVMLANVNAQVDLLAVGPELDIRGWETPALLVEPGNPRTSRTFADALSDYGPPSLTPGVMAVPYYAFDGVGPGVQSDATLTTTLRAALAASYIADVASGGLVFMYAGNRTTGYLPSFAAVSAVTNSFRALGAPHSSTPTPVYDAGTGTYSRLAANGVTRPAFSNAASGSPSVHTGGW